MGDLSSRTHRYEMSFSSTVLRVKSILLVLFYCSYVMPSLSPATRRANSVRRRNLNAEIRRLKNYYSGTYGNGSIGRTANRRAAQAINNMVRELAARRIQKAVRARQARARAHTRTRAPSNLVLQVAMSPARVGRLYKTYGPNSLKQFIM